MSVKIRLAVTGKKNQIAYRIVASETHSKRDGKFLEILGFYNPTSNAVEKLRIEKDKIEAWVKKGAVITPAVALLIEKGTLDRPKKPKVLSEVEGPKVKKEDQTQTVPAQNPQPQAQTLTQESKPEEPKAEEKPQEASAEDQPKPKEEKKEGKN